jgi:hypothetical protein
MKTLFRSLLLAAAGTLALGFAAPALADTPELDVIPFNTTSGVLSDTEIDLFLQKDGPPTAKITMYAPPGYSVNTSVAPNTTIGEAQALTTTLGTTPVAGKIVTDDPSRYAANPQAQACAPGTHAAVWVIELTVGTTTLAVPIYVDPTTGSETQLGSFKLQSCLPSSEVPEAAGGAPFGARLTEVDLDLPQTFTNPANADFHRWRALLTPYTSGTSTPNAAGTVEVRALSPIPQRLTLKGRINVKKRTITISGSLVSAGERETGIRVRILAGPSVNAAKAKTIATVKTKKGGVFSLTRKLPKTTFFFAEVGIYFGTCTGPGPAAPGGCVRESVSPAFSNILKAVPPKKRKH